MADIFDRLSRASALALFEIALLARKDPDDMRQFFNDSVNIWEQLDAELLAPHPRDPDHA